MKRRTGRTNAGKQKQPAAASAAPEVVRQAQKTRPNASKPNSKPMPKSRPKPPSESADKSHGDIEVVPSSTDWSHLQPKSPTQPVLPILPAAVLPPSFPIKWKVSYRRKEVLENASLSRDFNYNKFTARCIKRIV